LQILNKEAYRLHGIECCGFNTSNIQGDLLFGSGDGDNAGNTGFADEICEECETPVGGCCITIAGDELAKLSQNAKVFLSTAWGSGEYECNLQGYWGDYSPESSSMPVDGATPDFSQKSALTFNPFSKTCIVESVSYHIQTLLDEANLVLSNFGGGALAALNLTQYQAMAVATAYYDAIINYNFMSRIRGYKSSGVVPNANEKNRATIIDYSTAVELPVYLTYINQRADRISALLGILLGLESSGGPSTMPKAWDYNIETGEECDISEAMSSELYPKCLKNGEPIPPSPACHDICGRPADAPDFTIGDFIDTHGSNPSGGETMFYYPPMDEECLPAVPWHDPCQGGYDGGWEDVPSIFVAVVAFPELGDCLHADDIQQILENCNAEYYFASGNIRDTASAGGFSSVFDYLKSIGERQRRANSSPIQR
jgi:hypothetical protein